LDTKTKVRHYWENHPLYSHELQDFNRDIDETFTKIDNIKKEDVEKFALAYWQFDKFRGKKLLDVGCGPGWISYNYLKNGTTVYSFDITYKASSFTKNILDKFGSPKVCQADAEHIPFKDDYFDIIVSSGVLHHTPNILKTFQECYRVLRPKGCAKITLYYKGTLHKGPIFKFILNLMKLLDIKHPGWKDKQPQHMIDQDDFIRMYDGQDNPIGIGKKTNEWIKDLQRVGFKVEGYEYHFFPKRFIPLARYMPNFMHYLLDKYLGTMVYFNLKKLKVK